MAGVKECQLQDAQDRFELLIGEVLPRFVALSADQIDAAIVETQRQIVQSLEMDRAALFSLMDDGSVVMTHNWHVPEVPPAPVGLSASRFLPFCLATVERGQDLTFSKISDLPPEAARDLSTITDVGPKSCAAIPLTIGGRLIGALTFETIRSERDWPESLMKRLRLVASIFASALARKRATEAANEVELRLGLATDSADLGAWTLDAGGRIWATSRAYQMYDVPPGTHFTLEQFLQLVHEDDRAQVDAAIARSMTDGSDFDTEYRIRRRDGTVRWIHARGRRQPLTATGGGQLMGVSIDTTARNRLEEELRLSLAKIQELNSRLKAESAYLSAEIKLSHVHDQIIGQSLAIRKSLSQVDVVAPTNTTVLLLGETGTGKELFASAVHDSSSRRGRLMIRVNCGAIPTTLIESELFGREKGAYTGALSKQIGRFELADHSTLFLDEIGELPMELQVRLLRVLEEKRIERLGSPRSIAVDFRLVAATNRDLEKAVAQGTFRQDLFYRLNVFQIRVPPLRDRIEDIPLLVRAFVAEFAAVQGKQIDSIDQDDMEALQRYAWPGNVRELRNVIERAVIVCSGPRLRIDSPRNGQAVSGPADQSFRMEDVERTHLKAVLDRTGWRIRGTGGAAELLDLKPTTLEARMQRLGLIRPTRDGDELQNIGGSPTYRR